LIPQAAVETIRCERSTARPLRKPALRLVASLTISALRRLRRWRRRLFLIRGARRFRILARLWFTVRTPWPWRLLRVLRPLTTDPWLAFTPRRIFPFPPLFSMSGVALLLGVDEFLPRVAVVASWPPITTAGTLPVFRGSRRFLRLPQLSAREIFHLCVRVLLFDALEGRQQLLTDCSPECGRKSAGDDCPVCVTGRHGAFLSVRRAASAFRPVSFA